MDLGIHNVQGIDVWAPKGPKPYGKAGANICNDNISKIGMDFLCIIEYLLTGTAPKAQPPTPAPAKPQPEPIPETQDHTTQEIPQLEALSPPKDEPDYQTMKAQMEKHQSSSTKVVKQEQVSQQVTQQQVTLTESAKGNLG